MNRSWTAEMTYIGVDSILADVTGSLGRDTAEEASRFGGVGVVGARLTFEVENANFDFGLSFARS
jgi:hypothetical protein